MFLSFREIEKSKMLEQGGSLAIMSVILNSLCRHGGSFRRTIHHLRFIVTKAQTKKILKARLDVQSAVPLW